MRLPIPPPGLSGNQDSIIVNKNSTIAPGDGPAGGLLGEFVGTVDGHRDGHGFVRRAAPLPPVYIAPNEMRSVLHGDTVRVRVVRQDRKGRPEGRILDILERRKSPLIGRLLHENGAWIVAPEDRRYGRDILIPKAGTAQAKAGQVVCVELTEPPSLHAQPVGRVTEVLGDVDDPGMEIEIAVRKYGVPHEFPASAVALAESFPARLRATERKGRVDLTDVALVTIDGEDARDFDDAVYCEPIDLALLEGDVDAVRSGKKKVSTRGQGTRPGWRLLVAIADVSHYVKPDDALDQEAYERATSVYFPRRVIPMLPERLSNGLCSLNPDEDRLSMVCDMLVDEEGALQAYQFFPAVIRSHARLTYTEVAAILSNTRGIEAQRRGELVDRLVHLHGAYRALLKQRTRRGAVDFETTETQIVCDDNGRIEKIVPRVRNEAHRLIEEAMLAANVCAADFIRSADHAVLYRVHEGPTPEKRSTLQNYLRSLGIGLSLSDDPTPAEYQAIARATRERPDATQVHQMLLRSMQQAIYTPANSGHFGLAYDAYAHFTSPIRRYPDLLVHRVIKALLGRRTYRLTLGSRVTPLASSATKGRALVQGSTAEVGSVDEAWVAAGAHTSACERRADDASRDVEAWLKCRFMRDRLGEEFSGTVTSAVAFGLFVTLDELFVEGLVHVTELGGEYFRFDEVRQELRGERSGMRYGVGSRVRVQVSRVDLDARKIDFRLVREGSVERPVPRPRADRVKPDDADASAVEALAATQAEDRSLKAAARRQRKGVSKERGAAASRKRTGAAKALKSAKTARSARSR